MKATGVGSRETARKGVPPAWGEGRAGVRAVREVGRQQAEGTGESSVAEWTCFWCLCREMFIQIEGSFGLDSQ